MSAEYVYGAKRRVVPKRPGKPSQPRGPEGKPGTGHITRLVVGQGHGFIRLPDQRKVFFHRGDLQDGTRFNDLRVGDRVTFELLEDAVSGPRALRVTRTKRHAGATASATVHDAPGFADDASDATDASDESQD